MWTAIPTPDSGSVHAHCSRPSTESREGFGACWLKRSLVLPTCIRTFRRYQSIIRVAISRTLKRTCNHRVLFSASIAAAHAALAIMTSTAAITGSGRDSHVSLRTVSARMSLAVANKVHPPYLKSSSSRCPAQHMDWAARTGHNSSQATQTRTTIAVGDFPCLRLSEGPATAIFTCTIFIACQCRICCTTITETIVSAKCIPPGARLPERKGWSSAVCLTHP